MILHKSRDDFQEIVLQISGQEGIRPDVLEKDYYVTLMLEELSRMQLEIKAYFKGGTALYKALSAINRFSEDIDLTVRIDDLSTSSQQKKRLEKSGEGYSCLERLKEDPQNAKNRGSITAIYGYEPIFNENMEIDPLQRFGRVKIEATSFSVSEPVAPIWVAPALYQFASEDARLVLRDQFNVMPFEVLTITLERIFVDKIFAAEFYYRRFKEAHSDTPSNFAFDVAKHIYDLMLLHRKKTITNLLGDRDQLQYLISLKRKEEHYRKGGVPAEYQINDFSYLRDLLTDQHFLVEYNRMQDIYVFKEDDKVSLGNTIDVFNAIRAIQEF